MKLMWLIHNKLYTDTVLFIVRLSVSQKQVLLIMHYILAYLCVYADIWRCRRFRRWVAGKQMGGKAQAGRKYNK